MGQVVSKWANIQKGVPQGSILGPLLFNIFLNDIFYFIERGTVYNYADDNTLSYCSINYDDLLQTLKQESQTLIDCFHQNCMQANPEKFQAIAIGKRTIAKNPEISLENVTIKCEGFTC